MRYRLWEEISQVKVQESCKTWCVIGDFNVVRSANERKDNPINNQNSGDMVRFNEFIKRNELYDISTVGRRFTWYQRNGTFRSRLDRALVTEKWLI